MRAAGRARDRLRVKAAVGGIVILRGAVVVQRPVLHGRVGAVIGQAQDHGVARAAIGAVDVRVVIARVGWIEQLCETVVADRQVRRDRAVGVPCARLSRIVNSVKPDGLERTGRRWR